ncbi:MLO-like protein 12 isoform X2 [Vigna angularis]|uniref:MLO-like protein 12 isoform X2 n=1 Tax=Phaseolus angularis TaxID=3914 RepID=UPI0022B4FA4F|nr:MLO-like protein 12 isoform X2 [Vigna angularis]
MEIGEERSLEETATWAVSVFCFFFLLISLIIEGSLHKLTELLRKRKGKSLGRALTKTKTVPISKICINKDVATYFLPCKDAAELTGLSATHTSPSEFDVAPATNESEVEVNYCEAKGMVSLISSDGILQLNIFISFLAVFHILFCTLTMCLGKAKMRRWKRWEEETRTLEYQIANDPRRFQYTGQTTIGKRHLNFWSYHSPLLWMVCFIRQFYISVSEDDYYTLRNGFIAANVSLGSNFNFKKFLSRTYDEDFEKVMGIRIWIWIFSILFIFFSAHEFYNYYWLPFIPLMVALLAGTKLQVIITKMCVDSCKANPVIKGSLLVTPSDAHFWFHRPEWLLHLLKFILIQNSFQLAFFTWTWYEFGPRSCFNRENEDIGIRIGMGIAVQLLCGYVTLPLFALVTQMGSSMRREIFTESVSMGLKNWHKRAKQSLQNKSTSRKHSDSLHSKGGDNSGRGTMHSLNNPDIVVVTNNPSPSDEGKSIAPTNNEQDVSSPSTSEITATEAENSKIIITRGTYDGEISFGSSWKNVGSSRAIREIVSITEEDDAEKLPDQFIHR